MGLNWHMPALANKRVGSSRGMVEEECTYWWPFWGEQVYGIYYNMGMSNQLDEKFLGDNSSRFFNQLESHFIAREWVEEPN